MRKIINLIIEGHESPTSSEIYAICNDGALFRLDFGGWTKIKNIPQDGYEEISSSTEQHYMYIKEDKEGLLKSLFTTNKAEPSFEYDPDGMQRQKMADMFFDKELKIEVGKVYECKHGQKRLCISYDPTIIYGFYLLSFTGGGNVFRFDAKGISFDGFSALIKLSDNQSHNIILASVK